MSKQIYISVMPQYHIYVGVMPQYHDTGKYTEDGEPIIIDVYSVWATMQDGRRFQHVKTFAAEVPFNDETGAYVVPRYGKDSMQSMEAAANKLSAKVEAHLAAGGQLNFDHWVEIEASYGSAAWEEQDKGGFFAAQEKLRDGAFEASPPTWLRRFG
jgi:hypothetical protein